MKLVVMVAMVAVLAGCASSQTDVLGPAPTTTEAVLAEELGAAGEEAMRYRLENALPDPDGVRRYEVRDGVAELAPRARYATNRRLVFYFYPRVNAVGGITPGYAIEVPLYERVHVLKPGEF